MSFPDAVREGLQPSFRLPFQGIVAPYGFAPVARTNPYHERCTLGEKDLIELFAVDCIDGI